MDYIDGAALQVVLRALWQRGERMPLDVGLRIFLDALAGLHAAHELTDASGESLHLVHRDVSPQNILVGSDGIARLTDFGVARARSRLTTTDCGQLKGKLTYMAPEQVRSEPIDRRADIYAAGVVLWEMLASERLMRGDNDGAIVERILAGVSRSPRDVVPSVPEPLAAVCMRALRFEREDRFPTAAAFADALEAAALEAGIGIATPRAVSGLLKDLHIEGSIASVRAVSGELKTLTAPLAEQPTVRERATPLEATRALPSSSRSNALRNEATRVTIAGRLRDNRRGILVSAGLVALALTGWLVVSGLADGVPAKESPAMAMTSSTARTQSLDPPSAIMAPQGSPGDTAIRTSSDQASGANANANAKDVEAPKSKRGEVSSGRAARVPPPSATAFRPREL
jgi:serine/threonine-protein kinase